MKEIQDASFGVIPFYKNEDGSVDFCLVCHKAGHWSFPKGHPEEGEDPLETALRECMEESGIAHVELMEQPFYERYTYFYKDQHLNVHKTNTFYLGEVTEKPEDRPHNFKDEIPDIGWFNAEETLEKLTFPETKEMFKEALAFLKIKM